MSYQTLKPENFSATSSCSPLLLPLSMHISTASSHQGSSCSYSSYFPQLSDYEICTDLITRRYHCSSWISLQDLQLPHNQINRSRSVKPIRQLTQKVELNSLKESIWHKCHPSLIIWQGSSICTDPLIKQIVRAFATLFVKFLYINWALNKRVLYISLNEVPS